MRQVSQYPIKITYKADFTPGRQELKRRGWSREDRHNEEKWVAPGLVGGYRPLGISFLSACKREDMDPQTGLNWENLALVEIRGFRTSVMETTEQLHRRWHDVMTASPRRAAEVLSITLALHLHYL